MTFPCLPNPHPPRRHLVLTGLGVVWVHLALLGSPLPALSSAAEPATRPVSPVVAAHARTSETTTRSMSSPSAQGLSLRIWTAPAKQPAVDEPPTASSAAQAQDATPSDPVQERWTVAQSSTESQQSLRPNPTENKASVPVKVPNSARLQFDVLGKVKGFGYTVSGELAWQQDGRQYQSRFEIGMPLLGSRVQTSQGQIGPSGLMPTRFGDKVRSEQAAHFERDKGLISFSANTPSAPLEPGAQDRLSLFMQLSSLLAGAPQRYPTGTQITLQTVSAREAEPWTFRVDAPETLQLPVGSTLAVRLTRLPRQPYDQQVDLWFAPSLGYLPVRLRVTHPNGDVADQVLRRLDPPG